MPQGNSPMLGGKEGPRVYDTGGNMELGSLL